VKLNGGSTTVEINAAKLAALCARAKHDAKGIEALIGRWLGASVRGGFGPSDEAAVLVRIPSIAGNRPGEYTVARGALAQPVVERPAGDAHTIEETTFTIEASWSEGKEKTVQPRVLEKDSRVWLVREKGAPFPQSFGWRATDRGAAPPGSGRPAPGADFQSHVESRMNFKRIRGKGRGLADPQGRSGLADNWYD